MTLASEYDGETIEHYSLRWQQDLTGAQRAAIASEVEKKRLWPEYRLVKPATLLVDDAYQRPLSEDRVWSIVRNFTPRLFNALYCSERTGKLFVVDGRHRLAAANILGPKIVPEVWTEIRRLQNIQEEAQTFVELTERRRNLTSAQRFVAKLLYRDPIAVELNSIMHKYRFTVPSELFNANAMKRKPDELTSVATLEKIFKAGGRTRVAAVLQIVRLAWKGKPPSTSAWMLRGISRMLERDPSLNPEGVAQRLSERDPWSVIERGERLSHSNDIPASDGIADVLLKVIE